MGRFRQGVCFAGGLVDAKVIFWIYPVYWQGNALEIA